MKGPKRLAFDRFLVTVVTSLIIDGFIQQPMHWQESAQSILLERILEELWGNNDEIRRPPFIVIEFLFFIFPWFRQCLYKSSTEYIADWGHYLDYIIMDWTIGWNMDWALTIQNYADY